MKDEADNPPRQQHVAEFDAYAAEYSGGMDNPIKALAGASGDDFLSVKVDWLARHVLTPTADGQRLSLLDYGCGRGDLLNLLARRGFQLDMIGSDVSGEMLKAGAANWSKEAGAAPRFMQQEGVSVALGNASLDLIVISSVLHHVSPEERSQVFAELHRLLKPGGRIVIFEHNPLNPVTRYVVAHTPIDANAILLRAKESADRAVAAGLSITRLDYIMFAPPRLGTAAQLIDRIFCWLPLGAQYALLTHKDG